ncbi:MAG: NAD(+)/NADH kinase [Christensenellaceae bacterium]
MIKFGIYTNPKKDIGLVATREIIKVLERHKCEVFYDKDTAKELQLEEYTDAKESNVLLILGGDGTILRAARKYVNHGIYLVGLNIGRLGFMSEIDVHEIDDLIDKIAKDEYVIDERMMLSAYVGDKKEPMMALNDFVIAKHNRTRMIQVQLSVNGTLAENYNGDGLIIATPTGSTAYSLSAGGPIVAPNVNCILITPMCPHSLYARSIITKYSDVITVQPKESVTKVTISADGQPSLSLGEGQSIVIMRSEVNAKFLRVKKDNFFPQLKDKLAQWNVH